MPFAKIIKPFSGAGTLVLALIGLLSISLALGLVYPRLTAAQHLAGGYSGRVEMPWLFGEISRGNRLSVSMPVNWLTPRRWHITPDDRLTALSINGQAVPLEGVRPGGLSDWRYGFDIDLSPWLHRGDNQLEFVVDNYAWYGSLGLDPRPGWRSLLLAAALLPWLLALARAFRLSRWQTALLGAALLVLCCYWEATPWTLRNYDVKRFGETGHLGYVEYVATHLALPSPGQGWEYYQPPLYYIGGALVWRWAQWLGLPEAQALQALALALWLVFLAASMATLRLALRRSPAVLGVASAALLLWPAGIIHGLRIGNDPPLYAAAAAATWFMFRWWRGGRRRHLLAMAACIALALLCKGSALALPAAAAALIALRLLRAGGWRQARHWIDAGAATALMTAGLLLSLGRNFYYWRHGEISNWLIGNIGSLDADLRVPNQLRYFLPLDIPVFLSTPWLDTRVDATGRANFWNFLLRSALSGEFSFEGTLHRVIAIIWGVVLLWLLALLLMRAAALRWSAATLWREAPWIVLSALWLLSVVAARINYPFSCESDFRFILPVLLPFIIACGRGGRVAQTLLLSMALSSTLFFITL